MGADTFKSFFLPVKRQMITELVYQDKGQKSGSDYAAGQNGRSSRSQSENRFIFISRTFTVPAGIFISDMALYIDLFRDDVQAF